MKRYDAIVVGGGHNGLTCAAYLAKSGKKVLVLEARDEPGGIAVGGDLGEGFTAPGPAAGASRFRAKIVRELGLAKYGLVVAERPPRTRVSDGDESVTLSRNLAETTSSIREISKDDAAGYLRLREFVAGIKPVIDAFTDSHPLDVIHLETEAKLKVLRRALGIRRLGRERMMELLRVPPMSAADFLSEYIASDLVKSAIALPAIAQTWAGPRAPGTAANVLLSEAGDEISVQGGAAAVVRALVAACKDLGVEIRTGAKVTSLALEGKRVAGVHVAGGEDAEAPVVVGAIDPRQLILDLVPRGILPARTERRTENWRCRGTVAHLALAVDGEIDLGDGAERLIAAGGLDELERAFDAIKYRTHSENPVLDISAPSGLGPEGKSVLSIRAHNAPLHHEQGYGDETRAAIEKAIMTRLATVLPDVADKVLASRLWCPPDIEVELCTTGGHIEHGEMGLDQILVRPIPECSGYESPIAGLYLGSSGSHPGGGFNGLPGMLAAAAVGR